MNRSFEKSKSSIFAIRFASAHSLNTLLSGLALALMLLPRPAEAQSHACHGPPDCYTVGSACLNGTLFAGCGVGEYYPIFTTRCDAGQTWSGSCTGTRASLPWNNGNSTGYTSVSTSETNGKANTATLITSDSNSGVAGTQPHQAAQYCADLVINGHDDWYLPSLSEMRTLHAHQSAISNFTSVNYLTSTQKTSSDLMRMDFSTGNNGTNPKQTATNFRCTRRN